jgi:hypothetical protein
MDAEPGSNHNLTAAHLRELHVNSGIPLELIAAEDITTITTRAQAAAMGYTAAWQQALVPAIAFPVHPPDGSNSLYVLKPDQPRPKKDKAGKVKPGKFIKYEWPVGHPHRLDTVGDLAELADPAVDLYVVEGKKKALALQARGLCAIAVWGTYAWCRKKEDFGDIRPELLGDWDQVNLDARRVFVVFDSDRDEKADVDKAARDLADRLAERGAEVYHVSLPSEPDGSKNGADDLIVRHGFAAFERCVEQALDRGPHGQEGLRAAWRRQRERVRELERERAAIFQALRNPNVKNASHRLANVLAIAEVNSPLSRGRQSPLRMPIYAVRRSDGAAFGLAPSMGLSRGTVKAALELGCGPGGPLVKETRFLPDEGHNATFIQPAHAGASTIDQYLALARLDPTPGRVEKRGGSRTCPDHPGAAVYKRSTWVCAECGQLLDEQTTTTVAQTLSNGETHTDPSPLTYVSCTNFEQRDVSEVNTAAAVDDQVQREEMANVALVDRLDVETHPVQLRGTGAGSERRGRPARENGALVAPVGAPRRVAPDADRTRDVRELVRCGAGGVRSDRPAEPGDPGEAASVDVETLDDEALFKVCATVVEPDAAPRHGPPPSGFCPTCGCGRWWLTAWGGWLCDRCHPEPLRAMTRSRLVPA